jgi:hypothetical protein
MRTSLILVLSLLASNAYATCTISQQWKVDQPLPQTITKTWTDSDANCDKMASALVDTSASVPVPNKQQAIIQWMKDHVSTLRELTNRWQKATAPITPVDPSEQP